MPPPPPPKKRRRVQSEDQQSMKKSYLQTHFSTLPESSSLLKNGHVLHVHSSLENSRAQTERMLKLQFPEEDLSSVINSKIKNLVTKTKKLRKLNNPKEFEQFEAICHESFDASIQTQTQTEGTVVQAGDVSELHDNCDLATVDEPGVSYVTGAVTSPHSTIPHVVELQEHSDDLDGATAGCLQPSCLDPPLQAASNAMPQAVPSSSARKTRSSAAFTPRKRRLKKRLNSLAESKVQQANKFKAKIRSLTLKLKSPKRVLNQAWRRKNEQIRLRDKKIKDLLQGDTLASELAATKDELAQIRRTHAKLKKYHSKNKEAGVPLHQHRKVERKLIAEKDDLELQLHEERLSKSNTSIPCKKDGKTFNSNYRRCVYNCILNQVPVEATGQLIKDIVKEMTESELDSVAGVSTVSQCAYELGVLADIQVAETLEKAEFINIAWDATSLDAEHVNEVHVNCGVEGESQKSLVMQVEVLAGGTTADYVTHISQAIRDVTNSYAEFRKVDPVDYHQKVVNKLKSTLSDRVNVNHCVTVQLEEEFNIDLIELKCNVHPLDGLASEARKSLKIQDKETEFHGSLFGKDSATVNVIYSISKMRYKNGKGDPKGFKHFMKTNNIKPRMVIRYVGNRMHVLFHLAGTFYFLHEKLLLYLRKSCNCQTGFRTSLIKDLSTPYVKMQLQALGLVGKLLTGPWMTVLYSNKDVISNLEAVPLLKTCVEQVKLFCQNPRKVLEAKKDCFEQSLKDDEILASLQGADDQSCTQEFAQTVGALLQGCVRVLERQLAAYITGDLSSPSPRMLEVTKSAPVHNIASERILGLTDSQYRRAPNATVGFIDGKVKGKKNRTLDWLRNKCTEEQECLISYAISRARKYRRIRKEREEHTTTVYQQRLREKVQKKDRSFRRKVEKKIDAAIRNMPQDFEDQIQSLLSEVDKATVLEVMRFVADLHLLVDKYIYHMWDLGEDGDVLHYGKILELKTPKRKPAKLSIAYWLPDEGEDDSSDSSVKVSEMLTDYLLGDLTFSA